MDGKLIEKIKIRQINNYRNKYFFSFLMNIKKQQIKATSQIINNLKKPTQLVLHKLGGVVLYNQKYERHIQRCKGQKNKKQRPQLDDCAVQNERNEYERDLKMDFIDEEIQQFVKRRSEFDWNTTSLFQKEISSIISIFKQSQLKAAKCLEQFNRRQGGQVEFQFQKMIKEYQIEKHKRLIEILKMFNTQNKKGIKTNICPSCVQNSINYKVKQVQRVDSGCQTFPISTNSEQISFLKKTLMIKEQQYNILLAYKGGLLLNEEQKQSQYRLSKQQFLYTIKKLQKQVAQKNVDIKRIALQMRMMQESYQGRLTELRRHNRSSMMRSNLNIVDELIREKDLEIPKQKHKKKKRAQSIMSMSQSLMSSKTKDYDEFADYSIQSMREFNYNIDRDGDSRFNTGSVFKKRDSYDKRSLFKILQRYMSKDNIKKSAFMKQQNGKGTKQKVIIHKNKQVKQSHLNQIIERELREGPLKSIEQKQEIVEKDQTLQNKRHKEKEGYTIVYSSPQPNIIQQKQKLNQDKKHRLSIRSPNSTVLQTKKNALKDKINQNKYNLVSLPSKIEIESNYPRSLQKIQSTRGKLKNVGFNLTKQTSNMALNSGEVNITLNGHRFFEERKQNIRNIERYTYEPVAKSEVKTNLKRIVSKKSHKINSHHKNYSQVDQTYLQTTINHTNNNMSSQISNKNSFAEQSNSIFKNRNRNTEADIVKYFSHKNSPSKLLKCPNLPEKGKQFISIKSKQKDESESKHLRDFAKSLAFRCESRQQYLKEMKRYHLQCEGICQHIQYYLDNFEKYRLNGREAIRLSVQNLNLRMAQK